MPVGSEDQFYEELHRLRARYQDETAVSRFQPIITDALAKQPPLSGVDGSVVDQDAVEAELANSGVAAARRFVLWPHVCYESDHWVVGFTQQLVACGTDNRPNVWPNVDPANPAWQSLRDRRLSGQSDLSETAAMADLFAWVYHRRPVLRSLSSCDAKLRHLFLSAAESGFGDALSLRTSVCGDVIGATLAAEQLFVEYGKFLQAAQSHSSLQQAMFDTLDRAPEPVLTGAGTGLGVAKPVTEEEMRAVLTLLRQVRRNGVLSRILRLAGRYWSHALNIQTRSVRQVDMDDWDVGTGASLQDVLPSQFWPLGHPNTRLKFLADLADASLLVRRPHGKEVRTRGPIVVAVDESGSMDEKSARTQHSRFEEAKAVGLTLANLARLQNRWFALCSWSSKSQFRSWVVPPDGSPYVTPLTEFAAHRFNGGTHLPLAGVMNVVDEACGGGVRPDVVFITDGDLHESQPEEAEFVEWRKKNHVRVFGMDIANRSGLLERVSTNYYPVPDLFHGEVGVQDMFGI